jgi:uncharacterized protein (UPF0333 family)
MQSKPIAVITVLLLVVVALLVSGCTTTPTSTTNQTPSAITEAHNATLENIFTAYKNQVDTNKNISVKAWELTWINSTSAHLEWAQLNKSTNATYNVVENFMIFPTTQDATSYLNTMNKTAYSLASTVYEKGFYQTATGHSAQTYKQYGWNEGNPFSISEYKYHQLEQVDTLIRVLTLKRLN